MIEQNENECVVAGVKYIAVSNDDIDRSCRGCAGNNNDKLCMALAACGMVRQDKRRIIWVADQE
jgi:hypothetical protein